MGLHWKIQFLGGWGGGGWGHEIRDVGGDCLKRGLEQFTDLRGVWQKIRG